MKTQFKTLLLLLMAVPLLLISCAKDGINDKQDVSNTVINNSQKTDLVYCGTPMVAQMVDYDQTVSPATVTIGNDGTNLLIKYELSMPGWYINLPALFVGTEAQLAALPGATVDFAGSGTVYFTSTSAPFGLPIFPMDQQGNPKYIDGGNYWEHIIPLNTLPECFIVVAYARIREISTLPNAPFKDIWGKSAYKTSGYYLDYCVQDCAEPTCETAYAKAESDQLANCFLNIQGVTSDNWGWSNGQISPNGVTYTWPMYAGAGQCNVANGTHVGNLTVVYNSGTPTGTATVTYNTLPGYELNATHLYVGSEKLPRDKKGKFTTAPGQFPYKHPNLNGATTDIYEITGLSGPIYIAAHSEVCGYY
jgi:hypothetical protein